jgi:hypothetical protein
MWRHCRVAQRDDIFLAVLRSIARQRDRAGLGVDLGPTQAADLLAAAPGQEEKPQDVAVVALPGGPPHSDDPRVESSTTLTVGTATTFLVEQNGGFNGWSKSKVEFDNVVKIDPWTVHDLRRTIRTGLGKLGVPPHIAEAVLNHLPPKMIRTYDRHGYLSEKWDALDKWASHLKVEVAKATGANVMKLPKKKRHQD